MFKCLRLCVLIALYFYTSDIIAQVDSTEFTVPKKAATYKKFLPIPLFSVAPETSLRLGVIGVYFFRFKNAEEGTQLSSIRAPQSYTLKNQVKFRISNDIFFNSNNHIVSGFTEWLRFPLFFYGIGSQTQNEDKEIYTSRVFNINYSYFKKIKQGLYAGLRFDRRDSKIQEVAENGLLEAEAVPGSNGGVSQGFGLTARWDSRDNFMCTKKGWLTDFQLTFYNDAFNSDFEFTKMALDNRLFFNINDKTVLGNQTYIEQNWGQPSFESMALMGGPFLMRGNFEGRFRDNAMWATQWEYRIPIGRTSWINEDKDLKFWHRFGAVGFVGVGNVMTDLIENPFDDMKITGGVGLRFLAFPEERINLRIDMGFGTERPAFYIFVRESF
ncbi:MAG: BamA/TamA family outer membrane protein [Cyclobacteriaceae bacterium]